MEGVGFAKAGYKAQYKKFKLATPCHNLPLKCNSVGSDELRDKQR